MRRRRGLLGGRARLRIKGGRWYVGGTVGRALREVGGLKLWVVSLLDSIAVCLNSMLIFQIQYFFETCCVAFSLADNG